MRKIDQLRQAVDEQNIPEIKTLVDEFYNVVRDFSQCFVTSETDVEKYDLYDPIWRVKCKDAVRDWGGGR